MTVSVLQAQEVELDQPDLLDAAHVVLRHDVARLRVAVQRHQLDQRAVADHDARRVRRGVARQALELARRLEEPLHLPVRLDARAQLGRLRERLLELDAERLGHQLRDPVDVAEGHAEHAPDVADRRLRLQRPEGHDLRDAHLLGFGVAVPSYFSAHVADHLVAAAHAEVDVDVRHRDALGVEEALEDDVVLDRIDAGDAEPVRDEAAGRGAAARPDRNAAAPRVVDEVRDDQEVAGEAHLTGSRRARASCARRSAAYLPRQRLVGIEAEPRAQPRPGLLVQHLLARASARHLELGHVVLAHLDLDVAALGDLERRVARPTDGRGRAARISSPSFT